ncbi:hypothetical protein SELMODRAFT_126754 [Selaginella moellendorffii]|uniref:Fe2OG dioxygenase domain-containing protein n=1 Tax=Selaginella moellendorffii TaxID=88036 RepID=D8SWX9_SELML|nr:hypothetical protein SELMODRAFT_126754 [Selaginella moellendorffii]
MAEAAADAHPNNKRKHNPNGLANESKERVIPRLLKEPNLSHAPDNYDDLVNIEYPPSLYSTMEQYLPSHMLTAPRDKKLAFMDRVLVKYRPNGERARVKNCFYLKLSLCWQRLHEDLYTLDPDQIFVEPFRKAVENGSEAALREILTEHSPGVFTFTMLQPGFCSKVLEEVAHFEKWAHEVKVSVLRPNTMNNYGAVLDDIGMETMLDQLMMKFIRPFAALLFFNVGGATLDTHHGFVVEYSIGGDLDLGFHVDDSEVTLNVCLGKEFDGGELFFRGVRCDAHVNGEARSEEMLEYSHVPGRAILHAGRHRHGAKAITSGQRTNLILWCRSSEFRELKKYQRDFSAWCGECLLRKKERRRRLTNAKRQPAA